MSEIVNHKKVITFSFAQNVYPIFLNNPSLIYLKNERNNVIELPEIGFMERILTYLILYPFMV